MSWNSIPVPAGINLPTTTFSLRPLNWSCLPVTAASVRTLVVSWNEAAEMNDVVASEAFVIPRSTLSYSAGLRPLELTLSFSSSSSA